MADMNIPEPDCCGETVEVALIRLRVEENLSDKWPWRAEAGLDAEIGILRLRMTCSSAGPAALRMTE
jgi:hypothetical protein